MPSCCGTPATVYRTHCEVQHCFFQQLNAAECSSTQPCLCPVVRPGCIVSAANWLATCHKLTTPAKTQSYSSIDQGRPSGLYDRQGHYAVLRATQPAEWCNKMVGVQANSNSCSTVHRHARPPICTPLRTQLFVQHTLTVLKNPNPVDHNRDDHLSVLRCHCTLSIAGPVHYGIMGWPCPCSVLPAPPAALPLQPACVEPHQPEPHS